MNFCSILLLLYDHNHLEVSALDNVQDMAGFYISNVLFPRS